MFLSRLSLLCCPFCGARCTLVRHGFVRWFVSPEKHGIRAWRLRCKKSARRNGCGKSWSIRLSQCIPRRCFSASQLWAFIRKLLTERSVKRALERSEIPISLDTGYRLCRRLCLCQSVLRTHLCARAPPPKIKAGTPLLQVFAHLKEAFGRGCPIRGYQETFQRSFLAIA